MGQGGDLAPRCSRSRQCASSLLTFVGMGRPDRLVRGEFDFVGRTRALEVLESVLIKAREGHGSITTITGKHGIGKTRLAYQVQGMAESEGLLVLWGRASGNGAPDYWPWSEIVTDYSLQGGTGDPVTVAPEITGGSQEEDAPWPANAQYHTMTAVREFLTQAAQQQPLLVILDDAHACDPSSLRLLKGLAEGLASARIAFLATCVPAQIHGQGNRI